VPEIRTVGLKFHRLPALPAFFLAFPAAPLKSSEAKNNLSFHKYILGQPIFMGSRKSITLTSPKRSLKVSEQANKREAIRTH